MFIEISLLILALVLETSRCSLVIDGLSQDAVYVADYCPKMKFCMEGAHVMCMYYNPHNTMGPRCSNPQNVSITPELATKLLDVSNAIRSKVALGKEKGKNGEYLPKGYGMFRLKWDNELATFAQVLANQCVLRHDLCRATNRFPDPGQTAGLVRFTFPDWYPVSRPGYFKTPGLSDAKVTYAVMQTLKSWYSQKNSVTKNMIQSYPDWSLTPDNQGGRLYLEMIFASATHMGCGISAYTEYAYFDNNAALNYNSIQVICNYSAKPRKATKVFNTSRPGGSGYTIKCGCPAGSREDVDCLCNEFDPGPPKTKKKIGRSCNGIEDDCEPTMVLLPIFTVEDAPPEKLMSKAMDIQAPLTSYIRKRFDNVSIHSPKSREIYDFFADTEADQNSITHALKTALNLQPSPHTSGIFMPRQLPRDINKHDDAMNRYFDPNKPSLQMKRLPMQRQPKNLGPNRKSSIFTRVEKFQLPTRRDYIIDGPFKKDVAPRRDFSNAQKLVNTYLKKRRIEEDGYHKANTGRLHEDHVNKGFVNLDEDFTTETILNKVEEKVMSYNQYIKPKFNLSNDHKVFNSKLNEENENKLLTLLDTLEREVKHTELDGNEKEIFDAKLRRIYGSVVGKPVELLTMKQSKAIDKLHTDYDLENELIDLTHFSDDDKAKHDPNRLKPNDIRRHDNNHISDDERKIDTHYNDKRLSGVKNYDEMETKITRPTKGQSEDELNKDFREYKHTNLFTSDEEIKKKNYDLEKIYKPNPEDVKRRNTDEAVKNKGLFGHKNDDDPLSFERRKYYQDKLENLQRRLHDARNNKHRNEHTNGQVRRMRPNRDDMQMRPSRSKSQIDAIYMPDRARYVHGY